MEKKDDRSKNILDICGIGACAGVPNSSPSEIDQSTKLTFSQPVQIPGHVLRARTYLYAMQDRVAAASCLLLPAVKTNQ